MSNKFLIINVLPTEFYSDCRIRGSISIPLDRLDERVKTIDHDTTIILYCASYNCSLSHQAHDLLKSLGFADVLIYLGGMNEWYNAGLPVEGVCRQKYLQELISDNASHITKELATISLEDLKRMMAG